MDRLFLEEYEHNEAVDLENFLEDIKKGEFKVDQRYPAESRLKLNRPYAYSVEHESIWPLVPIYGTIIVRLLSIPQPSAFHKYHGFEVEDIPRLVDFSKRTGKIAFALEDAPTRFEGIHFLEPIFYELRPPMRSRIFLEVNPDDVDEFASIAGDYFGILAWAWHIATGAVQEEHHLNRNRAWQAQNYAELRCLGFDEIADYIKSSLIEKRYDATAVLMGTARDYLLNPYLDPLKPIPTQARDIGEFEKRVLDASGSQVTASVEFPFEVGKFLTEKLNLIVPKNMDGAIEIAEQYNETDIKEVIEALDEAIKQERANAVITRAKEISEILENIWSKTKKVRRKQKYLQRYGISLSFAAIGTLIGGAVGGAGGLLAGLGFSVVDKLLGEKASRAISGIITKWTTANYMMHLYDFRRKYRLF